MIQVVTEAQLAGMMPRLRQRQDLLQLYTPHMVEAMVEEQITTRFRICAFLAQIAHESAQLRYMHEVASGREYEGRKDLGNTEPGDGVRYKGAGPFQLTGRLNYRLCGIALGLPLEEQPELAMRPEIAFRTATWFWHTRNLDVLADQCSTVSPYGKFDRISHKINGGWNGRFERRAYFQAALRVITIDPPQS